MANLSEIKQAIKILNKGSRKNITLLHCVSSYHKLENLNLNFMKRLKIFLNINWLIRSPKEKSLQLPVGLGAKIIEKHITFSKKLSGPDHKASMTIKEFEKLVKKIRIVEKVLGKEEKIITRNELQVSKALRKSCVSNRDIKKGEIIKKSDIVFKRPGIGLSPIFYKKLIGKKMKRNIKQNKLFTENMF